MSSPAPGWWTAQGAVEAVDETEWRTGAPLCCDGGQRPPEHTH